MSIGLCRRGFSRGTGVMETMERVEAEDTAVKDRALRETKREFTQLAQRYAALDNSMTATGQRERSTLQRPLMKLYVALHPGKGLTEMDDIDVILRARRRLA